MAALPYMPLFVADYLADTAHLTPAQHGAYLLLIMNYWQRGGPLPNDDARLARIVRMSKRDWAHNRADILEFFHEQDNLLYHSRITSELSRVEAKSLKCKDAAQASVERRFGKRSTPVEPTDTHTEEGETNVSPRGRAQGHRLPDDWEPKTLTSDSVSGQIVAARGHDWGARALESFRNHWRSANGPNARKRDWQAAWANWIIEQDNRDGRRTNGLGRHQPSDGLSSTGRAAISVFGAPSPGQHR